MPRMILLFPLLLLTLSEAESPSAVSRSRQIIHLMDYLAQDYAGAVRHGQIVSATEYAEQQEFASKAQSLAQAAQDTGIARVLPRLERLKAGIEAKAEVDSVRTAARSIKESLVASSGIPTSPARWPDFKNGAALFAQNCITCHGNAGKGDGPAAASLNPAPANFHDEDRMELLSPFQVFNTIRLGVEGTGMPAFPQLEEKDVWDLAAFVLSLRYSKDSVEARKASLNHPEIELSRLSISSDQDLARLFPGSSRADKAAWRLQTEAHPLSLARHLDRARAGLARADTLYQNGRLEESGDAALFAYLDGIEPLEPRLRSNDPAFVARLESAMLKVRSQIRNQAPAVQVQAAITDAKTLIDSASDLLRAKPLPPWAVFAVTFGILLREGFEALLVVIAILGAIRAAGIRGAAPYVHAGWVSALGAGGAAWFFSGWIARLSGAGREMSEGISSLFAVAVLLYMGFWMHRKAGIDKWKEFIQSSLKPMLGGGGRIGLALFSFLVVFREAFETVLFLSALDMEGAHSGTPILIGVITALAFTLFVAWFFLRAAGRMPIRKFFAISSVVMAALAVILAGKGLHALQEAGKIAVSSTPWNLRSELLGFYPTYETFFGQLIILIGSCLLLNIGEKKSKNRAQPKPQSV